MTIAIVMNTLNGAVTEHDLPFHSMTADHAGGDGGLFSVGGNTDGITAINAHFLHGKTLIDESLKKMASDLYFSMTGAGTGQALVHGRSGQWSYPFPVRADGESRAVPGRGIRENYLAIGFRNQSGADFSIDQIEFRNNKSSKRRI